MKRGQIRGLRCIKDEESRVKEKEDEQDEESLEKSGMRRGRRIVARKMDGGEKSEERVLLKNCCITKQNKTVFCVCNER